MPRPPLHRALLPALLFWATLALLHWVWPHARWLAPAAQLWLAYSAAWFTLNWRWWPLAVPLAAALGAAAGTLLLPAIDLVHWQSPLSLWRPWLPAFAFALLMHLPLRWWRWREEQAIALRLARAEHTAAMAELSRQVSLTELKALQAQVEPHFLFNALASLQQLIRSQPATAERFLGELHDYLRLALPSLREPMSTLDREFELARAYLTVMATRLGERLRFDLHAQPGCNDHPLPPLMLLTLVENAVRHGIEPKPQGGRIDLDARREGERFVLEVRDDGVGLQAAPASPTPDQGLGLANLRDRLAGLYCGSARLSIQQPAAGGVCARIELPWEEKRNE
ncbi:signal transduction histidine kinase [Pelomonas aquatica]|uniref:Signal transduction histidine kinase n=1 Tax=Pelomonas aquatica TaxID=431058 RepID=A0ABU1Z5J5_9BURK|nr:histidine kinase [Pelomonas aquatica]MDR7295885.1 signal transduction histidine kinase [Pelomonas aquatica]